MNPLTLLDLFVSQPAFQAATIVAICCGLIGPLVVSRGMAFAVHGTSELAFAGAAAALLLGVNPYFGALAGTIVVALSIGLLGAQEHERDATIAIILAFGLGLGLFMLSFYPGSSDVATDILFGDVLSVSRDQLAPLLILGLLSSATIALIYRPLLFASIDPEVALARGVPVKWLGLLFLVVLAVTVTSAAQIVGTLLVLSLTITPAAAAQRLSVKPSTVTWFSIAFALLAANGGVFLSLQGGSSQTSIFVVSLSFALYILARLAGHFIRDIRQLPTVRNRDRSILHRLAGQATTDQGEAEQPHDHSN